MSSSFPNLRFAVRQILARPGQAVFVILILAVGIGLAVAMFSILDGVMLRGLPFDDAAQIVSIALYTKPRLDSPPPWEVYEFLRTEQRSFQDLAAFSPLFTHATPEEAATQTYVGAYVTANLFPLLRVGPHLGRTFDAAEPGAGADPAVLLGYAAWKAHFGGDSEVLGATVLVNRAPMTVVGVMPPGFGFPFRQEIWPVLDATSGRAAYLVGRLEEHTSLREAQIELDLLQKRLQTAGVLDPDQGRLMVRRYVDAATRTETRLALRLAFGGVLAVLLLVCLNAANLRLAQIVRRYRELAVRSALGASQASLVMLLLWESFLIAVAGAVGGVLVAVLALRLFDRFLRPEVALQAFWIDIRVDGKALAVGLALGAVAVLLGGLTPALRSLWEARGSLGGGGSHSGNVGRGVVIGEIALACALLLVAGLLVRGALAVRAVEPGFSTEGVLAAELGLHHYDQDDEAQWLEFYRGLVEGLENRSEVAAVGIASQVIPYRGSTAGLALGRQLGTELEDLPPVEWLATTPGLFAALDTPLLVGRQFSTEDHGEAPPVAIVSASLAERYMKGGAVGEQLEIVVQDRRVRARVVGVVADVVADVSEPRPTVVYTPLAQGPVSSAAIAVRGRLQDPSLLIPVLREEALRIDRRASVFDVEPLALRLSRRNWGQRTLRSTMILFSGVSLFLAAIGLYAVMSLWVRSRVRELGIRTALGATPQNLRWLVFQATLRSLATGLLLGLVVAAPAVWVLRGFVRGLQLWDPIVLATVLIGLALVGLIATLYPARRAARTEPALCLRQD